jgi:hypothetical protein
MEQSPYESTFRWKWLAVVPVLLIVCWLGYRWVTPAYTPPSVPAPNAYDALVSLSAKVAPRTAYYAEMPDQELAVIVKANEPILIDARQALRQESAVSLDWMADQGWLGNVHMPSCQQLRELARAFAAEARHARAQGDTRRAVACGLEALQLVKVAAYGGLGVDFLVGLGINAGSAQCLRDSCETASLEDCRFVLNNLPNIQQLLEDPEEITIREWHFFRRINGIWTTFMMEMTFANNRSEFEERMKNSLQSALVTNDLLRLHYAIRAFKLAEDRLPKSLEELVERELKEIPKDPFSQRDFIYQPGKDRYILYSVGPNGEDDGGVVNDQNREQGDLVLEPYDPEKGSPESED